MFVLSVILILTCFLFLVPYRLFSTKKNKKKSENNLIRVLICGQIKLIWVAGSVPALVPCRLFSAQKTRIINQKMLSVSQVLSEINGSDEQTYAKL